MEVSGIRLKRMKCVAMGGSSKKGKSSSMRSKRERYLTLALLPPRKKSNTTRLRRTEASVPSANNSAMTRPVSRFIYDGVAGHPMAQPLVARVRGSPPLIVVCCDAPNVKRELETASGDRAASFVKVRTQRGNVIAGNGL